MITIHTTYTNKNEDDFYNVLLDIYEKSIRKNMKDVNLIKDVLDTSHIKNFKVPFLNKIPKEYINNPLYKLKLQYQKNIINKIKGNIILSDCDMLLINSVKDVFDMDFDIAFTDRENLFLNTGIVFIKNPNPNVKKFFEKWIKKIEYFSENPEYMEKYKYTYTVAVDQCSLGILLEEYEKKNNGLKIKYLPSSIYNSCQDTWEFINNETKIVHIKSELRKNIKSVFNGELRLKEVEPEYLQPIIKKWFEYYNN